MKKIIHIIFRIILALLIITPILGVLGIFPEPTADMYKTPEAYTFIKSLYDSGYILYINASVFFISLVLIIMNRMALASLFILPISVNIVAFHAFLDGGLFTGGAIMGNILFILTIYFVWKNRAQYKELWRKETITE